MDASAVPALKVLYVEDDRLHIILMEEVFRSLSPWQLLVAETGAEALQCLAGERVGLMLLDMNLPDMTGLQLMKALRAERFAPLPPCIALSADALPEQIAAAREAGFDDYWLKPIDVPRLQAHLQAHLGQLAHD